jgi:hypothetical protein
MTIETETRALIARLEAQWNANDMDGMAALWDLEDPSPFYQAEEEEAWADDWPKLRDYWRRTQALNQRIAVRYGDLGVKPLGPDLAFAFWRLHWDIKLSNRPNALGGDNRVFAVVRRTPAGARLCCYVEGPLAPITYMRKLYEASVTPGF